MREPLMERSIPYLHEPIQKYYLCTNPLCGSGQFAAGDYHEDDDGRRIHFKPFQGQDICHVCGGEMYPK